MDDVGASPATRRTLPWYMRRCGSHSVVPADYPSPSPSSTAAQRRASRQRGDAMTPSSYLSLSSEEGTASTCPPINNPFIEGYDFWNVERRERRKLRELKSPKKLKSVLSSNNLLNNSFDRVSAAPSLPNAEQPSVDLSPSNRMSVNVRIRIGEGTVGLGAQNVEKEDRLQREMALENRDAALAAFTTEQKVRSTTVKSSSEQVKELFFKQRNQLKNELQMEKKFRKQEYFAHKEEGLALLELRRSQTAAAYQRKLDALESIKRRREEYSRAEHADAQLQRVIAVSRSNHLNSLKRPPSTQDKSRRISPRPQARVDLFTSTPKAADFFASSFLSPSQRRRVQDSALGIVCEDDDGRSVAINFLKSKADTIEANRQIAREMKEATREREALVKEQKETEVAERHREARALREERELEHTKALNQFQKQQEEKRKQVILESKIWQQLGQERKLRASAPAGSLPVVGESGKSFLAAMRVSPSDKKRKSEDL